jgi:hypothetical protein
VERESPWATLISVAGAAGGAVVFVYAIGGLVLSLRYEGFGLNGQEAAALTSREFLLFSGATTLARWLLIGLGYAAVLFLFWLMLRAMFRAPWGAFRRVIDRTRLPGVASRTSERAGLSAVRLGILALLAVTAVLVLVPHVWWLPAAFAAVALVVGEQVMTRRAADAPRANGPCKEAGRSAPRALRLRSVVVTAAAIALVAVAYEADRLSYRLNWACVDTAGERTHTCGILIGQNDRGLYIGAPKTPDRQRAVAYRLVFVPANRVREAFARRRTAMVTESSAEDRRQALAARLVSIDVR